MRTYKVVVTREIAKSVVLNLLNWGSVFHDNGGNLVYYPTRDRESGRLPARDRQFLGHVVTDMLEEQMKKALVPGVDRVVLEARDVERSKWAGLVEFAS